ncbi:MAG TPA: FAD-dependent oxidoreductase, partial [bacterium]|nr:FAD-dependent oxidoreductase [bacterium]
YDEKLEPYASCWMCIVEIKGRKGVFPACATLIDDGMEIFTNTDLLNNLRKTNLELLFSNHYADCYAPCKLTCPSNIDIQAYIAYINRGDYRSAIKTIKEDCPLPVSIGRICPHPCEEKCRRNYMESAVAINNLKRFVADWDLNSAQPYIPPIKEADKKFKVAIIGAGPAGLSCAYYLAQESYTIDIYEMMPAAGGMLRYGIPEYRLPKEILQKEIDLLLKTGDINILFNKKLGRDFTISSLQKLYNAIFIGIGAWQSNLMNIEGENLNGIYQGIDFLRDVNSNKKIEIGKKVAVIGGGNTAIDAARTSLRLGAEKVFIIYRRAKEQMPANEEEIQEAAEEGIEFLFLTNPVKYFGDENNRVKSIECIKMKLGEKDQSGRAKPVPIENSNFKIDIDNVILAIGQYVDKNGLSELQLNKDNTIIVNTNNYQTNLLSVFAGGDAVSGPDIAIRAINAGKHAARAIINFLNNKEYQVPKIFSITKETFGEINKDEFAKYPKIQRNETRKLDAEKRKNNNKEVANTYTENEAKTETMRCLSCGCNDVDYCKLKEYGEKYKVDFNNFLGEIKRIPVDISHPYIIRNNNKCINCGKCVRICLEYQGPGAFGYIYRGFDSLIASKFNLPFVKSECTSCGQCIVACPTGALMEKVPFGKPGPYKTKTVKSKCLYCNLACNIELNITEKDIISIRPEKINEYNYDILCSRGKFNFFNLSKREKEYKKISLQNLIEIIKSEKNVLINLSPVLLNNELEKIKIFFNRNFGIKNFSFDDLKNYIIYKEKSVIKPISMNEVFTTKRIIYLSERYERPDYEVILKKIENTRNIEKIVIYKDNQPFEKEKMTEIYKIENFNFDNICKILNKYNDYILLFDLNKIVFIKTLIDFINKEKIKYYLLSRYINEEGAYKFYQKNKELFNLQNDEINIRINIGVLNYERRYNKEIIIKEFLLSKEKDYDFYLPLISRYEITDNYYNQNGEIQNIKGIKRLSEDKINFLEL